MDLLHKLNNISNSGQSMNTHPVKDLDIDFKIHYLNGLALLMNADDVVAPEEKKYIKILLNTFGLPEESLDEMVAFSKDPAEEAINDILTMLVESGELRYVFLLDCVILANTDDDLHDVEKMTTQKFSELLKISIDSLASLEQLEIVLRKKEKTEIYNALQNLNIDQKYYTHTFDYYSVDIDEILSKYLPEEEREQKIKEEQARKKSMTELKAKLKDKNRVFVSKPNGEGYDGKFISLNENNKAVLNTLELIPLSPQEEALKERLGDQWDEMGEEEDRLMDKAYPETDLGEMFAGRALKKLELHQEKMERILDEHDSIEEKEIIHEEEILSKEDLQAILEEIIDLTLAEKQPDVSEWLEES